MMMMEDDLKIRDAECELIPKKHFCLTVYNTLQWPCCEVGLV